MSVDRPDLSSCALGPSCERRAEPSRRRHDEAWPLALEGFEEALAAEGG